MGPNQPKGEPSLPVRPGTTDDPASVREIESPGDPGPTVLVPPEQADPRDVVPGEDKPMPGI